MFNFAYSQEQLHTNVSIIKFKSNKPQEVFELPFYKNKTIAQYKEDIAQIQKCKNNQIKFIFKGKVLLDKEKAGALKLQNDTVSLILLKAKQQANQKNQKTQTKEQNSVANTNKTQKSKFTSNRLNSVPKNVADTLQKLQSKNAINIIQKLQNRQSDSQVDWNQVQHIITSPFMQQIIATAAQNPAQMFKAISQNQQLRWMLDHPMFKLIKENPQMLKVMFNKEVLKMGIDLKKSGLYQIMLQNAKSIMQLEQKKSSNIKSYKLQNSQIDKLLGIQNQQAQTQAESSPKKKKKKKKSKKKQQQTETKLAIKDFISDGDFDISQYDPSKMTQHQFIMHIRQNLLKKYEGLSDQQLKNAPDPVIMFQVQDPITGEVKEIKIKQLQLSDIRRPKPKIVRPQPKKIQAKINSPEEIAKKFFMNFPSQIPNPYSQIFENKSIDSDVSQQTNLKKLREQGFSNDQLNKKILRRVNGNYNEAINILWQQHL